MSLLDLPDPLLENIIIQAAPMAACFLGCTCLRLQALFLEHEPRHLAAMARGEFYDLLKVCLSPLLVCSNCRACISMDHTSV